MTLGEWNVDGLFFYVELQFYITHLFLLWYEVVVHTMHVSCMDPEAF